MIWLGDRRGELVDWVTQRWVRATGRSIALADAPWLDAPAGHPRGIGAEFFATWSAERGHTLLPDGDHGLMPEFESLRRPDFDPTRLDPAVIDFYLRTSEYELDVDSNWHGAFRPFGGLLAFLFSRRLQQMNVPLSSLDTSEGMTSSVRPVIERGTGCRLFAAWVRTLARTGNVIFAGAYSTAVVPDGPTPCVRVAFPLPNGNAIVFMRPSVEDDGSLRLVSSGDGFGGPGFYFTILDGPGRIVARYLRTFRETIRVFVEHGDTRADHELSLWGTPFLRLHYRMRRRRNGNPKAGRGAAAVDRPN